LKELVVRLFQDHKYLEFDKRQKERTSKLYLAGGRAVEAASASLQQSSRGESGRR
jgi:hypothetical protein